MNLAFITDHLTTAVYPIALLLVLWLIKASRMVSYVRND